MRIYRKKLILAFISTFILLGLNACKKDKPEIKDGNQYHLLVPLYSYPTDLGGRIWYQVGQASNRIPVTVIWGIYDTTEMATYQQYLPVLDKAELLSYVATDGGNNVIREVKNEIEFYVTNFDIDGIFFDEVSSDPQYYGYYHELIDYARSFSNIKKVVLNSSYAPPAFLSEMNTEIVVIYEDYASEWDLFDKNSYREFDSSRKAVIATTQPGDSQEMKRIIREGASTGIGYFYVTDNDFDLLPDYWDEEVQLIEQLNE